jgi:lipopolysaccharide biosynthesis regulator YciM
MKLLRRSRMARHWVSALSAFERDDTESAIAAMRTMAKIGELQPHHLAFLGQVYAWRGESDKAKIHFERAKDKADGASRESEYIRILSDVYLTLIDREDSIDDLLAEAAKVECRPTLKRWLPLPSQTRGRA